MWKNRARTNKKWQYSTANALCMLNQEGYRHTLTLCNIYCFSTATMVTRMRLIVTIYILLPVLLNVKRMK